MSTAVDFEPTAPDYFDFIETVKFELFFGIQRRQGKTRELRNVYDMVNGWDRK